MRDYFIKLSKRMGVHPFLTRVYPYLFDVLIPTIFLYSVKINFRFYKQGLLKSKSCAHHLPKELIVSLTSYPARFKTLHLTLKCLLMQSMHFDRLVLWISYEDKNLLPESVLNLQQYGLKIDFCDNLRSFKKIIPSLKKYPGAYIVTADDDVFYDRNWLLDLVKDHKLNTKEIIGHRAHYINLDSKSYPLPYRNWSWEKGLNRPSFNNFLTGIGGVLYPPNTLHKDVTDVGVFTTLTPRADDVWLYWMARLNNTEIRRANARMRKFWCWPDTQVTSLLSQNVDEDGNDIQIKAINQKYQLFSSAKH